MRITLYPEEDAMYIQLFDAKFAYGRDMDDKRHLNFTADDKLIGIEFLNISQGVDLSDIPGIAGEALGAVLAQRNIR